VTVYVVGCNMLLCCVLRFEVSRSVITVQRELCARFRTAGSAKRYTQKVFSCCDAILETGLAVPQ
jgi:hypothetical protein